MGAKRVGSPYARKLKDLYSNMVSRCEDPRNKRWENYGARGIYICKRWRKNHRDFYDWCLSNGYQPGLQLDRINNNGPYSPSNCRFVSQIANQNNTTRSRFIIWKGQRRTVAQWARLIGVNYRALEHRLNRDWPLTKVFNQPYRARRD